MTSSAVSGPATLLVLVRHGRTALNADGRLRGLLDPPLDDVGREEVRRLGAALAPMDPARVLSSPLLRARETAQAIAEDAGARIELDARLLDRDYGVWAGHGQDEVRDRWGSLDAAPGVEEWRHVRRRAESILHEHQSLTPVVLVTHDAILRAMLTSMGTSPAVEGIATASWFTVAQVRGELVVTGHGPS